jgi:hypothetical protein
MRVNDAGGSMIQRFAKIIVKQWREANPTLEGNMRDSASVQQLLVLANIESLNAEFIQMGLPQRERLQN